MITSRVALGLAVSSLLIFSIGARAEEWPKWRGPDGTGISHETGLLNEWPASGLKHLWEAKVGEGFSSPIALDGKIYLFAQEGNSDTLKAFDAASGMIIWAQAAKATREPPQPNGANSVNGLASPEATPAIDGDRIYTYSGGGDLTCRQLADGKQLWTINVIDQTRSELIAWGCASSPLVDERLVYVQAGEGGALAVAVDKTSGKLAWKSQATGSPGYAAPILITVANARQLIIFAGEALVGMDPASGKTLWTTPWETEYKVNAATPIYRDGHLFITSNYGKGCAMLTVSATGVKKDWESKAVQCQFQPPILDGDHLYANSGGTLKCIHWPDGKQIWQMRSDTELGMGGSILLVGNDKIVGLSDNGNLFLVDVQPDAGKLVSQVHLFDYERVWSSPLVYRGRLYVKGKDQLICLDISAPK